jgi:hypothetical protein
MSPILFIFIFWWDRALNSQLYLCKQVLYCLSHISSMGPILFIHQ